jgi:hypothetical protein
MLKPFRIKRGEGGHIHMYDNKFQLDYVRICCIGLVDMHHLFYKGAAGPLGLPPPQGRLP